MGRGSNELLQAYRALYFISFGVMGLGAHFGGNMSHGSKFLTQHAPEPIKSQMISMEKWMLRFVEEPKPEKTEEKAPEPPKAVETAPTPTPATPAPAASEEKQKGELRLDTFEFTMAGGENSAEKKNNIVAGKPADSLTYQLVTSAEDEDMHMPPEGKDQLTKEEVALLKWWIEQGASNTQKVDLSVIPADIKAAAKAIVKG
jgi:hypothetical protein